MARAMKESGVEWIGEIPEEWAIRRGKSLFLQRSEKGNAKQLQLLSPTQKYGVIPQSLYEQLSGMKAVKLDKDTDISQLKTVHAGDYCISLRSFQGGFEYSNYEGVVSPAYQIFYPRAEIDRRFYKYLFKDQAFIAKMNSYTMSLRDGKNIAYSDFADSYIPVPPLPEQHRIADYLDHQCAAIDAVLEKTRASIEEYKKLKQAVITEAVTKGIRGNRPMKDSGIEWIGEIPEEWDVVKLKSFASLRSGITLGKTYPKETRLFEVPYLRVANVQGDHIDLTDVATLSVTEEEIQKYSLHANELLLTEGGDRDKLGRGTVWSGELSPCLHQNHVFAVTTNEDRLRVRFLDYVTTSEPARTYFDLTAKKTTNLACTNSTTIMRFSFALPSVEEQDEIIAYLDVTCKKIDGIIFNKNEFLTELETYKKSLIYEVVTGKREVPS